METVNRKEQWERIYNTKQLNEVSWYQPVPETSLDFIRKFNVGKDASIIDVGGGDSLLVDHLLDMGYTDISVLDISEAALERARARLGERSSKVKWIVADAANFIPEKKYDFWHDRAAFHFLTDEKDIEKYIDTVQQHIKTEGVLVIGTFSENGPLKCSGLEIKQYNQEKMTEILKQHFLKVECISVDHKTPFETTQSFIFCSFRRKVVD